MFELFSARVHKKPISDSNKAEELLGLFPVLKLRLLRLILLGLFPVGTLSCFASQTAGTHSVRTHSVGTLSCFPTNAAGTLSGGTLSVLTASVGTLSCWGSFRSDSFHHPGENQHNGLSAIMIFG